MEELPPGPPLSQSVRGALSGEFLASKNLDHGHGFVQKRKMCRWIVPEEEVLSIGNVKVSRMLLD